MPNNPPQLRRMVERLIIENRNSLNDPTTNEPYDVKGIADDVVELIQSRQQQLLLGLMEQLPKNEYIGIEAFQETVKATGLHPDSKEYRQLEREALAGETTNIILNQIESLIQNKLEGLS